MIAGTDARPPAKRRTAFLKARRWFRCCSFGVPVSVSLSFLAVRVAAEQVPGRRLPAAAPWDFRGYSFTARGLLVQCACSLIVAAAPTFGTAPADPCAGAAGSSGTFFLPRGLLYTSPSLSPRSPPSPCPVWFAGRGRCGGFGAGFRDRCLFWQGRPLMSARRSQNKAVLAITAAGRQYLRKGRALRAHLASIDSCLPPSTSLRKPAALRCLATAAGEPSWPFPGPRASQIGADALGASWHSVLLRLFSVGQRVCPFSHTRAQH